MRIATGEIEESVEPDDGKARQARTLQDAGHPEQSITNAPQGTTVGVTARPQGRVAAAARGVRPGAPPRPVEHSIAQPDLGGVAHQDDAALAAALGHGSHAGEGPEGGVIAATDRPGSLAEQDR